MGSIEKLAFYLLKKVNKAGRDYDLISDGDRRMNLFGATHGQRRAKRL